MPPANDLALVRRLAASEASCELTQVVLESLRGFGLDSDDLRSIIEFELGEPHWTKSAETRVYYRPSTSDYFSIWVDDCNAFMFLKLLVFTEASGAECLVVTSFKKDINR